MKLRIPQKSDKYNASSRNREKLLKIIESFPGVRYNDLARISGLNNGTLSHHLGTLEKNFLIRIIRLDGSNMTRYFSVSIPSEETLIIGFLKIKGTNDVIRLLLEKETCTFMELVYTLDKSPSTISFHVKRLLECGVLNGEKSDNCTKYRLHNPEAVTKLAGKIRNNLFDRSIDSFEDLINDF